MPIANCIVSDGCPSGNGNVLELWASESGYSSEHMTINILSAKEQVGRQYLVMAQLMLPSLWPASAVSSLQIGLAKSLATYFQLHVSDVQVITTIIPSGLVVENGHEIQW